MTNRVSKGQWDGVAVAAFVLLAFSFVFGGASREHALRLTLVELASLPLLVLGLSRLITTGQWRNHRFALGLAALIAAVPLIQLVPLPPAIWTGLAGRSEMVLALELAGLQPGLAPVSLSPDLTWQAFLALLPPIAAFVGMLSLSQATATRIIAVYLIAAVLSVLLGAAQLASGGQQLYVWATTAAGSVNGLFANRNHLATLLVVMLPFAVAMGAASLRRRHDDRRLPLWFGAVFIGIVVIGLAAIRSRAGVILLGPSIVLSLLAGWIAAGRGRPGPALIGLAGAFVVAIGAVSAVALPPVLERFDSQAAPEGRFENWPIVARASDAYLPLGSGIGSFDAVFRSVEPLETLDPTFFNHAHNDYLELWLEAGWPAAALLIAFLIWYGRRTWAAWRAGTSRERDLQRAASVGILMMLAHSAVDYPLRTATLAVLFAVCAALLEKAGQPSERQAER